MMNSSSRNEATDREKRLIGNLVQRRDADHHQEHCGPLIRISVSHGPTQHELHVPAQSTFGYMKKVLEERTGLQPEQQKILFRGQEKEESEYLHEAGVKDNSKVLLLEDDVRKEKKLEQMKGGKQTSKEGLEENEETSNVANNRSEAQFEVENKESEEMSKAFQAITVVRTEVDKLAERVAALEVAVNGGTKVAEDEFVVSSELLMRQLLKLDTIEAEGEARMERKAEVCRVQGFHEILDNLKARNSKPVSNNDGSVTVTTEWETFDSGMGSSTPPPSSSSTRITHDWESFD